MGTTSRSRAVLVVVGLTLWIVIGMAAFANAFPAGGESFGAGTGGSACAAAQGLAPQLHKEAGLQAACAPVAPAAPDVVVQAPKSFSPVGSPAVPVIAWLGVAALGAAAIVIGTRRVRHNPGAAV